MDLKDKTLKALSQSLEPEYMRLEDDDGISGFVVTRLFKGMSSLDRQERIEEILQNASLTQEERRQILMIAGLTPEEYDAVGGAYASTGLGKWQEVWSKYHCVGGCRTQRMFEGCSTPTRRFRRPNRSRSTEPSGN